MEVMVAMVLSPFTGGKMADKDYYGFNATDRHLIEQTAKDISQIKEDISILSISTSNNQSAINSQAKNINKMQSKQNYQTFTIIIITIAFIVSYGATSLPAILSLLKLVY